MFQQKYPHISISYEFAGFQDYWTKMTTQATGQNLPDLMQQDYAYITQWATNNLLVPLDDHTSAGTIKLDGVPKASVDGGRINGKLYAVNLGNNSQTIVLDVEAFEKAGVPLPDSKWTWADFERTANQLHSKLGIYGVGPSLADIQLWKGLYLGYGQWPFSTDGKTLAYSDDQKMVDYLKMIMRLQEAGAAPPQQEEIAHTLRQHRVAPDRAVQGGHGLHVEQPAGRRVDRRGRRAQVQAGDPAARRGRFAVSELPQAVAVRVHHQGLQESQRSGHVHRLHDQ